MLLSAVKVSMHQTTAIVCSHHLNLHQSGNVARVREALDSDDVGYDDVNVTGEVSHAPITTTFLLMRIF